MRFIVDECTGPSVARWLQEQNHQVFSVYSDERGRADGALLTKAFTENWILITNDKDFGEMVYRERRPHKGVILLRLENERSANKIRVLQQLLQRYEIFLPDNFIVVTENQIRFANMRNR